MKDTLSMVLSKYLPRNYRSDIDGIRGIAVLAVLLFHFFPEVFPGGFIGVDMFFVISGYLITSAILKEEKDKGIFSIFYTRRILRIFPALIVVLVFCFIVGWNTLFKDEFETLGRHIFGGVFFSSNFILWKETGYFDTQSELKPLLHLWSLSVEEQFYILWPLLLFLIRKKSSWIKKLMLITILLTSLSLNIFYSPRLPDTTFYFPVTRAWELCLGAFVPIFGHFKAASKVSAGFFHLIGLMLICFGFFFINDKTIYPSYWALFPTLGTFFLIISEQESFINKRLLSFKLLVYIGLISYPLYLWHWPFLSFSKIIYAKDLNSAYKIVLFFITFILAGITYVFIERPLRFGKNPLKKATILAGASICLGLSCVAVIYGYLKPYNNVDSLVNDWDHPGKGKAISFRGRVFYLYKSNLPSEVLFLGDSNIEQYAPRIEQLIQTNPKELSTAIFATSGGCPPVPIPQYKNHIHEVCINFAQDVMEYVSLNPRIEKIIIGASWATYFNGAYDNYPFVEKNLEEMVIFYKNVLHKEVILVLNIPTDRLFHPIYNTQRKNAFLGGIGPNLKKQGLRKNILERQEECRKMLIRVAQKTGVEYIDPFDYLCDKRYCSSTGKNQKQMYKDYNHMCASYVREHVTFLDHLLVPK